MSEQQAQGADAAIDLNNELKTRREKLAALREQGVAFPNDFDVYDPKVEVDIPAASLCVQHENRCRAERRAGSAER